jgi:ribosomal protein L40E/uncharacterized membrane protein YgdD (TMEM256/DUF423 family)
MATSFFSMTPRAYAQFGTSDPISATLNLIFYLIILYLAYLFIKMSRSIRRIEQKLGIQPSQETAQEAPPNIVLVAGAAVLLILAITVLILAAQFSSDLFVAGWLALLGIIMIVGSSYIFILRIRRKRPAPPPPPVGVTLQIPKKEDEISKASAEPATEETRPNVYCRYCGMENENDAVFCQKCGKPMSGKQTAKPSLSEIFCQYCGTKNEKHAVYCKKCGKKIPET